MKGILLINLGSPDSTDPKDVKKYLGEFLMDKFVIDTPYLWRTILVKGIILNTRPKKSAAAYQKIWWDEGSPLVVISERFKEKVAKNSSVPVALGMRYGSMSIEKALKELHDKGVTEVLSIPLYPHYAMSSTQTVVEKTEEIRKKRYPSMKIDVVPSFYNQPDYIRVLAKSIEEELSKEDFDHVLFSYHGIPERHILKTDPTKSHCKIDGSCCNTPNKEAQDYCYRHQCFETTKQVVKTLGLKEGAYSSSFQSRLGRDPWLKPYTDFEFKRFGDEGIKKLAVVTPAFVADCLETLEEIAMEGKDDFIAAGGTSFKHIPCLNEREDWVSVTVNWIENWIKK